MVKKTQVVSEAFYSLIPCYTIALVRLSTSFHKVYFPINETVKIKPFITKIANGNNEVNKDIIIFAFSRSKLALNKGKAERSPKINVDNVPNNKKLWLFHYKSIKTEVRGYKLIYKLNQYRLTSPRITSPFCNTASRNPYD